MKHHSNFFLLIVFILVGSNAAVVLESNDLSFLSGFSYFVKDLIFRPTVTGAVSLLGSCTTIISSDEYIITADLSTSGSCILIRANNVVVNCNGKKISGDDGQADIGIDIGDTGFRNNINITNCIVEDFGTAIRVGQDSNLVRLENVTTNSTSSDLLLVGTFGGSQNVFWINSTNRTRSHNITASGVVSVEHFLRVNVTYANGSLANASLNVSNNVSIANFSILLETDGNASQTYVLPQFNQTATTINHFHPFNITANLSFGGGTYFANASPGFFFNSSITTLSLVFPDLQPPLIFNLTNLSTSTTVAGGPRLSSRSRFFFVTDVRDDLAINFSSVMGRVGYTNSFGAGLVNQFFVGLTNGSQFSSSPSERVLFYGNFTPDFGGGFYNVTVEANDTSGNGMNHSLINETADTLLFRINNPPILNFDLGTCTQLPVAAGVAEDFGSGAVDYSVPLCFADSDSGTNINLTCSTNSTNASVSVNNLTKTVTLGLSGNLTGAVNVSCDAVDDLADFNASSSYSFVQTITSVNDPPYSVGPLIVNLDVGQTVTVAYSQLFDEVDNDLLTVTANSPLSFTTISFNNGASQEMRITGQNEGVQTLTFHAVDPGALNDDSDDVRINVFASGYGGGGGGAGSDQWYIY